MSEKKYRIGIDVGGTFTDAVVVDNLTYDLISKEKIPTTHDSKEGVAKGIIKIIDNILRKNSISPDDVVFIAHGTTQATNALLEGDVAPVGIIGVSSGKLKAIRAKHETNIKNIELAPGKFLDLHHSFINRDNFSENKVVELIKDFKQKEVQVVAASEAFGVDDPTIEKKIIELCNKNGLFSTAGHEITQLYGLKRRTRTAVINGSLIPKMMETADMTESCIKKAGIKTPLMIMRCDGGVMSVDEVRQRPILTMLSGLAAGVAGALMYEKVSDGIFFEVGGTSTDISVIKNGKVMIKYASVGGHKTYLNSLDIRTLGIAGGSMVKVENGNIIDVGPRSAHIAGKKYEVFVNDGDIENPKIEYVSPTKGDSKNYVCLKTDTGEYAYTLAGAANVLKSVPENDYAAGNIDEAVKAWEVLAEEVNMSVEETAAKVMEIACSKVKRIVDALIREYELNLNVIRFIGGGGSGGVLIPYLGDLMNVKWAIAKNAPFISTIGVALAMVREIIEKTVLNPSNQDIVDIRREVIERIVRSGADSQTVDVHIEVDKRNNILRAIATGATELRTKELAGKKIDDSEVLYNVSESMGLPNDNISSVGKAGIWTVYQGRGKKNTMFGLIKKKVTPLRVVDHEGIIRLQKKSGAVKTTKLNCLSHELSAFIDEYTTFSDAGATIPGINIFYSQKNLDLTGLTEKEQIMSLADIEMNSYSHDIDVIMLATVA
ncbi:MAG: hydantoinase/oxoprolinase family protein [bacterium]|nr:hydantoinase/oxoprolinase family protein [bacterium]